MTRIHWSKRYTTIPENCFLCSIVKAVSGIEHVTKVGDKAFSRAALEKSGGQIPVRSCLNSVSQPAVLKR